MIEQFQTSGLKGVLNTIRFFSTIQKDDVFDVTAKIDKQDSNSLIAVNRVMLCTRTSKILRTGRDQSLSEFKEMLSTYGGKISSKSEIKSIKSLSPELNTASNKMGDGYRNTANKIMLLSRIEHYLHFHQDLMSYEYHMIMLNNSATIEEI
jgi:hypothetical protein